MIDLVTITNAYKYGDVISSMHRLRYKEFVERLDYKVPCIDHMEYDQYDTLAAVYFVWRDASNVVQGALRISPTDRPYMIKDLWPQVVENTSLPASPKIWEATRLCINRELPTDTKDKIHAELLCALLEYALAHKIEGYIGVAPPGLWKHTFLRFGWPITFLGSAHKIDYVERIRAGWMACSSQILEKIRTANNINSEVLSGLRKDQHQTLEVA